MRFTAQYFGIWYACAIEGNLRLNANLPPPNERATNRRVMMNALNLEVFR
jgi:hypothetical protein